MTISQRLAKLGIAALCFGYFAAYVPYSAMTKMLTRGLFDGMNGAGFSGFAIQPMVVLGSFVGTFLFITLAGWWKFATHSKVFGISIPRPRWFTLISGVCTAGVIITTTLAYTFKGVSIVFAMLLMRGGILIMAPVIDLIARKRRRKIYWPSWMAALLSLAALLTAFAGEAGLAMTTLCAVDICLYLFVYFFRFLFMSNKAKSDDAAEKKSYFTEEQMVANPLLLIALLVIGLVGSGMDANSFAGQIWYGFTALPKSGYFLHTFLTGIFSYGTGLFGTLIFLDKRENTFTVPANRIASIIAGVIATYYLYFIHGLKAPDFYELTGVGLVLVAIVFLAYRSIVEKKSRECSLVIEEVCADKSTGQKYAVAAEMD